MKKDTPFSPPLFRKIDILIVVSVLIAAVLIYLFLPHDAGRYAVVRVDGRVIHTLPLDRNCEITLQNNQHTLILEVTDGVVSVKQATCPDGLCQATGGIHQQGQTIVCLPAHCSITVEGDSSLYDATTY